MKSEILLTQGTHVWSLVDPKNLKCLSCGLPAEKQSDVTAIIDSNHRVINHLDRSGGPYHCPKMSHQKIGRIRITRAYAPLKITSGLEFDTISAPDPTREFSTFPHAWIDFNGTPTRLTASEFIVVK